MKYLVGFLVIILVVVFSVVANGYALSVLWNWFFVPYFNLEAVSIPTAIGLAVVVHYLTHQEQSNPTQKDFKETLLEGFLMAIIKPGFALSFGWVITLFI